VSRGPYGAALRVVTAAGARGNSPACGGVKQSAHFNPSALPMLGAGQREIQNQNLENRFQAPYRKLFEVSRLKKRETY